MGDIEKDLEFVRKLLTDRTVPPLDAPGPLEPEGRKGEREALYETITRIREILRRFAGGDFDMEITLRGAVAGYLKTLQANLRHLTWQVEQVAQGDFTQRVDFMGNFSKAFNTLTFRLERSIEEQKEREASERTQIMLDATPLCCNFWDENMNVVDCNLEAVKLFDLKCKQEYLERFHELSPEFQPDGRRSRQRIAERIREAFEKGRVVFAWMHCKSDGEEIPAEITLVRVWRKDHFIVAGYTRDLRELKKTEDALDRQRLLMLKILDSSPVCFSILVEGKVRFVNPFMQGFLGIEVGEYLFDRVENGHLDGELAEKLREGETIHWRAITMRTRGGQKKEMLADLFAMDYYGENGLMVWLVDVTEIRKIEADLRKARDIAEDSARVKNEFLANMSHEIRTPMNAILGMMHLVRQTQLSEKQLIYIETTEKSARLLLRIFNDILDFSKLEAGKLEMENDAFSVRSSVEEAITVVGESAERKNLVLSYEIDPAIPPRVLGDSLRLKQVLLNLLNNAIKFTPEGSVRLLVRRQEQAEDAPETEVVLFFSVQDTGIGISEPELRRLFTPFTQADSSASRKYGGTGLGLAISKSLVEMMGGEIRCESREHKGSNFTFTTRFKLAREISNAEPKCETEKEDIRTSRIPDSLRGASILLVEDNKINQLVATELLHSRNFRVEVASNGLEAVEMVRQKKFDLVLMDIQMPEMDGLQATRLIRKDPVFADLPILAMTANTSPEDREHCLEAGMNGLIAKPIDPNNLYGNIVKWIPGNRSSAVSD